MRRLAIQWVVVGLVLGLLGWPATAADGTAATDTPPVTITLEVSGVTDWAEHGKAATVVVQLRENSSGRTIRIKHCDWVDGRCSVAVDPTVLGDGVWQVAIGVARSEAYPYEGSCTWNGVTQKSLAQLRRPAHLALKKCTGGLMDFQVLDIDTGQPLAGRRIALTLGDGNQRAYIWANAIADAEGRVRFWVWYDIEDWCLMLNPDNREILCLLDDGYLVGEMPAPEIWKVRPPRVNLQGTLVDEHGAVLTTLNGGFQVVGADDPPDLEHYRYVDVQDGRFVIANYAPGKYHFDLSNHVLRFEPNNDLFYQYKVVQGGEFTVPAGDHEPQALTVNLRPKKTCTLRAKLTAANGGGALAQAHLTVKDDVGRVLEAMSDAAGVAAVGLPEGRWALKAVATDYLHANLPVEIEGDTEIAVPLTAGRAVAVQLNAGTTGLAVAGAAVQFISADREYHLAGVADAHGRVTLTGVPDGAGWLTITPPDGARIIRPVRIDAEHTGLTMPLRRGRRVAAFVGGLPAGQLSYQPINKAAWVEMSSGHLAAAVPRDPVTGRMEVRLLPGDYAVYLCGDAYYYEVARITVPAAGDAAAIQEDAVVVVHAKAVLAPQARGVNLREALE